MKYYESYLGEGTYTLGQRDYVTVMSYDQNFQLSIDYVNQNSEYAILNLIHSSKQTRKPKGRKFYIDKISDYALKTLELLQPSWRSPSVASDLPEDARPPNIRIRHKLFNNFGFKYTIEGLPNYIQI